MEFSGQCSSRMCRIMKLIPPEQQRQLKPCMAFTESSTAYSSLLQIFRIAISSRKQIRNTMYLESQLLLGKKILILFCPLFIMKIVFSSCFLDSHENTFFSYFNSSSITTTIATTIAFFDPHSPLHAQSSFLFPLRHILFSLDLTYVRLLPSKLS